MGCIKDLKRCKSPGSIDDYDKNWLIHFGCVSEEVRVIFPNLDDCMYNLYFPWTAYCVLMACRLVVWINILGCIL